MAHTNQGTEGSSQGPFCMWQGLDFATWLAMLGKRPPLHWTKIPRMLQLTCMSVVNSAMGLTERLIYGRRVAQLDLPTDPVFILGHWRSGTTLLHNLMSRDPQFTHPNLYHVLAPQHFVVADKPVTKLTRCLLP